MREIIFDTETTGLDFANDRVIEIGCLELLNRFPTGRTFYALINPQGRAVHPDAQSVHGIGAEKFADKPTFAEVADEFEAFVDGATLVAHNANFDLQMINAEFRRIGRTEIDVGRVVDTLALAKRKHPLGPHSLDALCRRFGIDRSRRVKHGALLDSELLAEVYAELTGSRQSAMSLDISPSGADGRAAVTLLPALMRPAPLAPRLTTAERKAHGDMVERMGENAMWKKINLQLP